MTSAAAANAAVECARSAVPGGAVYADWAARPLRVQPLATAQNQAAWRHPNSDDRALLAHSVARRSLQRFLIGGLDTHDLVFTAGATAGLSLVATRLPWSKRDHLICHTHAHNALLGLRGPACASGSRYVAVNSAELQNALFQGTNRSQETTWFHSARPQTSRSRDRPAFAVLGFPGECNLTGALYPVMDWAKAAHNRDLSQTSLQVPSDAVVVTVVDAAALAASTPIAPGALDDVDLLVCSVYKITGSPTGLGALLVRRGSYAAQLLLETSVKSYFAGGRSVSGISVTDPDFFLPAPSVVDSLELGTPNLDAIEQLPIVLGEVDRTLGGMRNVHKRACDVANMLRSGLVAAFPEGGITLHKDAPCDSVLNILYGPIVSFSIYHGDDDGIWAPVGHQEVEQVLGLNGILVRAGCMCNPGACAEVLGLTSHDVRRYFERGHRCNDDMDVIDGRHVGVVRASFGWASVVSDAARIVSVLGDQWGLGPKSLYRRVANPGVGMEAIGDLEGCAGLAGRIVTLYRYAVKGCLGEEALAVVSADVDADGCYTGGIRGDRILGIECDESGDILHRKSCPQLGRIRATCVDADDGKHLVVTLEVVGDDDDNNNNDRRSPCVLSVSVDAESGAVVSGLDESRRWLWQHAGVRGILRSAKDRGRWSLAMRGPSVHVVSEDECQRVARELSGEWDALRVATAARANMVVVWQTADGHGHGHDSRRRRAEPRCGVAASPCSMPGAELVAGRGARLVGATPCRRCTGMNDADGEPLRTIVQLARMPSRPAVADAGPEAGVVVGSGGGGGRGTGCRRSTSFGFIVRWAGGAGAVDAPPRRAGPGRQLRVGEPVEMVATGRPIPASSTCAGMEGTRPVAG